MNYNFRVNALIVQWGQIELEETFHSNDVKLVCFDWFNGEILTHKERKSIVTQNLNHCGDDILIDWLRWKRKSARNDYEMENINVKVDFFLSSINQQRRPFGAKYSENTNIENFDILSDKKFRQLNWMAKEKS